MTPGRTACIMRMYRTDVLGGISVTEKSQVRLGIRVPVELRDAALEKPRRQDSTLSQVVRHFLREWVAENSSDHEEEEPLAE